MSELASRPEKKHEVTYDISFTKNLGNFQSVKIQVGLSQEGYGHPDATMAKVAEWVEENLGQRVTEVVAALEDSGTE